MDTHCSAGQPPLPPTEPCHLLIGQQSQPFPPSALDVNLFFFQLGLTADTRLNLREADTEMGSNMEDVHLGQLLGVMPVEGRGQKQGGAEGAVKL